MRHSGKWFYRLRMDLSMGVHLLLCASWYVVSLLLLLLLLMRMLSVRMDGFLRYNMPNVGRILSSAMAWHWHPFLGRAWNSAGSRFRWALGQFRSVGSSKNSMGVLVLYIFFVPPAGSWGRRIVPRISPLISYCPVICMHVCQISIDAHNSCTRAEQGILLEALASTPVPVACSSMHHIVKIIPDYDKYQWTWYVYYYIWLSLLSYNISETILNVARTASLLLHDW